MDYSRPYTTLHVRSHTVVVEIVLNRPHVHNAMNLEMINELTEIFSDVQTDPSIRVVILTGTGTSFCSGADIQWLLKGKEQSYETNINEAMRLAKLFYLIDSIHKPIIGKIQGPAIAGGVGLLCLCDVVFAKQSAFFSLSEAKIGAIPACIFPYVLRRIGESKTKELVLSSRRINSKEAKECNLIHFVVKNNLNTAVDTYISQLLRNAPHAMEQCKEIISSLRSMESNVYMMYTAKKLTDIRLSKECIEGLTSYIDKRDPNW